MVDAAEQQHSEPERNEDDGEEETSSTASTSERNIIERRLEELNSQINVEPQSPDQEEGFESEATGEYPEAEEEDSSTETRHGRIRRADGGFDFDNL